MATTDQQSSADHQRQEVLQTRADQLYERYGKPLEAEHWGEFAAIFPDGQVVLAPTVLTALQKSEPLGAEAFLFKIGERSIGRLR